MSLFLWDRKSFEESSLCASEARNLPCMRCKSPSDHVASKDRARVQRSVPCIPCRVYRCEEVLECNSRMALTIAPKNGA